MQRILQRSLSLPSRPAGCCLRHLGLLDEGSARRSLPTLYPLALAARAASSPAAQSGASKKAEADPSVAAQKAALSLQFEEKKGEGVAVDLETLKSQRAKALAVEALTQKRVCNFWKKRKQEGEPPALYDGPLWFKSWQRKKRPGGRG